LADRKLDLPPGVLQPREAVLRMAPYSPPTGGRQDRPRRPAPGITALPLAEGLEGHVRSVEVRLA